MILPYFFASFQWSLSSLQAVFNLLSGLPHTSFVQGMEGFPTGLALPKPESETAPCSSVCVAVSLSDGIKSESCCPEQCMRSVWPVPQAPCVPLTQISLSVRLWLLVLPADSWSTCPQVPSLLSLTAYMPVSMSCFNSLTINLYGRPVPLTAAIPLPTFSILTTQRDLIRYQAIQGIRRPISRWKRGQQMWI